MRHFPENHEPSTYRIATIGATLAGIILVGPTYPVVITVCGWAFVASVTAPVVYELYKAATNAFARRYTD